MPTLEQLIQGIRNDFVFRPRPTSLPPDLRPDWRIAILLLILLNTGRGGTASLKKLHVIGWVIRHPSYRSLFLDILANRASPDRLIIRFDPALNRALEFALGAKLLAFERLASGGLNVSLTEAGNNAARQINAFDDCLVEEKTFLTEVGKISESRIENILSWET